MNVRLSEGILFSFRPLETSSDGKLRSYICNLIIQVV
jgi:hypothetical protein